jgi:hypothetical protein
MGMGFERMGTRQIYFAEKGKKRKKYPEPRS